MPIFDFFKYHWGTTAPRGWRFWPALALLGVMVGCFGGVRRTGKVVGYQDGRVITKKGYYRVGELSPEWQRVKLDRAMVAFYHPQLKSTISTDSFCDQAYNDSSLESLTRQLFPGLQDTKVARQQAMMLNERGALQTIVSANLDGVPVMLNLVVLKKDWCLFDFFLVGETGSFDKASEDFEKFFRGFSFEGDV